MSVFGFIRPFSLVMAHLSTYGSLLCAAQYIFEVILVSF